jgi:gliding motility-associated-like protein
VHLANMKNAAILLIVLSAVCLVNQLTAQTCTRLGQNPSTALPVCGSMEYSQATVPLCGGTTVPGPCNETILSDLNPFWYKFTCYKAGWLGFEITPRNLTDDYDWQLFDVTGHDVNDVYTDQSLFVACNWSAYGGVTGASNQGSSLISCSGANPIWSSMPTLIEGHEYLLLVSHFTNSQSGYSLAFKGGTAEISDAIPAAVVATDGFCTPNSMYVKLDKPIKCSSIATDGSDFSIAGGGSVQVSGAGSPACATSFVTDSIIVELSGDLPQGSYLVNIKDGSDGNTLLNICDEPMAPATSNFRVYEGVSAEFTYQVATGCSQDTVSFFHDGARSVNRWTWAFEEGGSTSQNPVVVYRGTGNKQATLVVSNANCSDTSEIALDLPEKMNAALDGPDIICSKDPAQFTNQSTGDIVDFLWDFGSGRTSRSPNPDPFNFPFNNGEVRHKISLTVRDAQGCVDSAQADVVVVGNCSIVVPSAFTPNRDGRNDELYPTNAFNADNLVFRVFNRFGQMVFESRDWQRKWDGTINGQAQAAGTYIWTLSYVLRTTGRPYYFKGTTLLVR